MQNGVLAKLRLRLVILPITERDERYRYVFHNGTRNNYELCLMKGDLYGVWVDWR